MEMNYTFIYSVEADKTNQKQITVFAKNESEAYVIFIQGLIKSATLVINRNTKRRII